MRVGAHVDSLGGGGVLSKMKHRNSLVPFVQASWADFNASQKNNIIWQLPRTLKLTHVPKVETP